jgi:hypothetical protein
MLLAQNEPMALSIRGIDQGTIILDIEDAAAPPKSRYSVSIAATCNVSPSQMKPS